MRGNPRANHIAMWEGPFDCVWLDADAIVWGDFASQVRSGVDFQNFLERDFHSTRCH